MKQEELTTVTTNRKQTDYVTTYGRRKEATARVRLYKGRGETLVNELPIEKYFPLSSQMAEFKKPFQLTKSEGAYYATIRVKGSGKSSQLGSVIHGVSKALTLINSEFRPILKKAGLLTRDPRVKERRKHGLAQKARKGKQSPKR